MEDSTFKGRATITEVRFDSSCHQRNFIYLLFVSRFGHGQCTVDGIVYVFGGRAGTTVDEKLMADLHKWDPTTATWSQVVVQGGCAPCPRSFHTMVAPEGGKCFYVFGGCPQQGRLNDLHK